MGAIAPQEDHEVAEPVGEAKAEHIAIPLLQRLVLRRMEYDMTDVQRNGLSLASSRGVRPAASLTISRARPSGSKKRNA